MRITHLLLVIPWGGGPHVNKLWMGTREGIWKFILPWRQLEMREVCFTRSLHHKENQGLCIKKWGWFQGFLNQGYIDQWSRRMWDYFSLRGENINGRLHNLRYCYVLWFQVERLMTSVIAFVITVAWLHCEANCHTLLGRDDIILSEKRHVKECKHVNRKQEQSLLCHRKTFILWSKTYHHR